MTRRPRPTTAVHFTRVENLAGILADGLWADSIIRTMSTDIAEVGDPAIKERRRGLPVSCGPGERVGDYVPLYFTARSPMMYTLHRGGVAFDRVVYLQTSLEQVQELGLAWVASNRNAAQSLAAFTDDEASLDEHIDWSVVQTTSWGRTPDDPDRPYRRQAELLVHRMLPWEAIESVVAQNPAVQGEVEAILASAGRRVDVDVRPGWYF